METIEEEKLFVQTFVLFFLNKRKSGETIYI